MAFLAYLAKHSHNCLMMKHVFRNTFQFLCLPNFNHVCWFLVQILLDAGKQKIEEAACSMQCGKAYPLLLMCFWKLLVFVVYISILSHDSTGIGVLGYLYIFIYACNKHCVFPTKYNQNNSIEVILCYFSPIFTIIQKIVYIFTVYSLVGLQFMHDLFSRAEIIW